MSTNELREKICAMVADHFALRGEWPVDIGLFPDCHLWTGPYAYILLCAVEDQEHLAEAAERAQQGLDALLVHAEHDGKGTVDGYLVIALAGPPDPKTREQIRKLELDTSVCRKHVVWPEDGSWPRLHTVTILDAPGIADGVGPIDWPESLTTEEAEFRDDLERKGGGKRLAELHMEELGL